MKNLIAKTVGANGQVVIDCEAVQVTPEDAVIFDGCEPVEVIKDKHLAKMLEKYKAEFWGRKVDFIKDGKGGLFI